jgi:hypothetical protein
MKRWSSDRKALARIARKPKGRERWLYTPGTILLVDNGGGEAITSFSEMEALHFFLMWYRHRKAELQAEENILQRRAGFLVVDGGRA